MYFKNKARDFKIKISSNLPIHGVNGVIEAKTSEAYFSAGNKNYQERYGNHGHGWTFFNLFFNRFLF